MTDLLQILDLIFNGPLKAFLRYKRYRPIYNAFQQHILDCASATANFQATPSWVQPKVDLPICIKLLIDFVDVKNQCVQFHASVKKCFIKAGQWYNCEDELTFVKYDLARLTLGAEAVDKVLMFGNDEDACVQYTYSNVQGDFVPQELMHSVILEQRASQDKIGEVKFFYTV